MPASLPAAIGLCQRRINRRKRRCPSRPPELPLLANTHLGNKQAALEVFEKTGPDRTAPPAWRAAPSAMANDNEVCTDLAGRFGDGLGRLTKLKARRSAKAVSFQASLLFSQHLQKGRTLMFDETWCRGFARPDS